jgi:hypothetical protein
MYNDRVRQQIDVQRRESANAPRARINRATNDLRSDIPERELQNNEPLRRRRCDGTLTDEARPTFIGQTERQEHNGCAFDCTSGACGGWGLINHPVAMVYSPCQAWRDAYAPDVALSRGTMFAELDLPFEAPNRKRGCM